MNLKLALASTLLIATVTGCGGSDFDPETGFTNGDACPQSMIDAGNSVTIACVGVEQLNGFSSDSTKIRVMTRCKNSIQSFLNENPNVYCRAQNTSTGVTVFVDSDDYRSDLNTLNMELNSLN